MNQPEVNTNEVVSPAAEQGTYAFPLSFAQQRLWVIGEMEQSIGSAYNIYGAFYAKGSLDIEYLKTAIRYLLDRHESFKTTFDVIDGNAVQVIHSSAIGDVDVEYIQGDENLIAICEAESRREFDLINGPLFSIKIINYGVGLHVLSFCFHHIISDGWSVGVFANELQVVYNLLLNGLPANLDELPLQYADYTIWQREQFETGTMQRQLEFWKAKLQGAPQQIDILYDKPRKPIQSFAGDSVLFKIDAAQTKQLRQITDEAKATLFMTMFSVYAVMLSKYSLQTDLVIGGAAANRHRKELESIIGFLVNIVAYRVKIDDDLSFAEVLKEIKAEVLQVYDNQDVPFEKLLDEVKIPRDASRSPLFQVMFTMQNTSAQTEWSSGLSFTPLEIENKTSKYDLILGITFNGQGLDCVFQFNTDLFERTTVERMAAHYSKLVSDIITNPEKPVSQHSLTTIEERNTILTDWNNTVVIYPTESVVEMIETRAQDNPHSIALLHRNETVTYAQLNERSNQLAHFLTETLPPASVVAVCLERSPQLMVCMLGIIKAGFAYLAIDTNYPDERKQFMIADSGSALVLTNSSYAGLATQINVQVAILDELSLDSYETARLSNVDINSDTIAYVIYTSGSTGQPKGIKIHHGGLQNLVNWHNDFFKITHQSRTTQVAGISFDASVWEIWPALCAGARMHILDKELLLETDAFRQAMINYGITLSYWPTPLAEIMFSLQWPADVALKQVQMGGDKFRRKPSSVLPFTIIEDYGLAEASVCSTSGVVSFDPDATITIGKPIGNACVLILDKNQQLVPPGVPGEIYITGIGLTKHGYINRPDLTAERFIDNPFTEIPYPKIYRTGDTGCFTNNGDIRYFGRIDRQVKIRGHRVEIGEVESAIISLPKVDTCAVLVKTRPDGANQLVAFVSTAYTVGELRALLQKRIPANMIPGIFILTDKLPLTPNGKIDYKALENTDIESLVEKTSTGKTSALEAELIDIWEKVLGLKGVTVDDNFFELGGDSVNTIQVASKAKESGYAITSRQIFLNQTVRELALTLQQTEVTVTEEIEADNETEFNLHPIQQWFFAQDAPNKNHFNHCVAIDIAGAADVALVKQAFNLLGEHHAVLRLNINTKQPGITQAYNNPNWKDNFEVYKLTDTTSGYEAQIADKVAVLQTSLSITGGKLFHIACFKYAGQTRLVFVFHHLIVDTFSWRVLLGDFHSLYLQLKEGVAASLASAVSYKNYISYLNKAAQDKQKSGLPFWLANYNENAGLLPDDLTAASNTYGETTTLTLKLDEHYTAALIKDLQRTYRSGVNTILIAALAKTIAQWKNEANVGLSLEGLGRHEQDEAIDISRTVGWFTALYPLYFNTNWQDWSNAITAVKELMNEVPLGGAGYGAAKYLAGDESLNNMQYPQLSFNYHGIVEDKNENSDWKIADADYGDQIAASFPRQHLIDVNCAIENKQLRISWSYNPGIHHARTIESLATDLLVNITEIVTVHTGKNSIQYSPSDFAYADLTQANIEEIRKIAQTDIADIFKLTPLQSGILYHSIYSGDQTDAYIIQISLALDGLLDAEALRAAWQDTINGNETLKTAFFWENIDEPVQLVYNGIDVPWQFTDASGLEEQQSAAFILAAQNEAVQQGIDISRAPLLNLHLVKSANGQHLLICTYHHLIIDGWSMPLIFKEVFTRYAEKVAGQNHGLLKAPPYKNYIKWLNGQDNNAAINFWKLELNGVDEPTCFQPDKQVLPEQTFAYAEQKVTFSAAEYGQLKSLLKKQKITLNALFQGIWGLIIDKYQGKGNVVFGTTVSGRPPVIDGIERMVGLFINTIPVNITVDYGQQLFDWLKEIHLKQVNREEFSYLTLTEIQQQSSLADKAALFDSLLIVENYPSVTQKDDADAVLKIEAVNAFEQIEMPVCVVVGANDNLNIKLSYDANRFTEKFASGLLSHFVNAINYILVHDNPQIKEVNLLSNADVNYLYGLNKPVQPISELTLVDYFGLQVERAGEKTAVTDESTTLTYHQLDQRVETAAAHLVSLHVAPQPIAILMDRSVDMLVALLAVMKSGSPYIPLDTSFPAARITATLADAQPALLIKQLLKTDEFDLGDTSVILFDEIQGERFDQNITCPKVNLDDSAYIIYTSGSTGKPKGVEIVHRALSNLLLSFQKSLDFTANDTFFALTTISFDIAALELYLPLLTGGTVFIAGSETAKDPHRLIETLEQVNPSYLQATPATWNMLFDADWKGDKKITALCGGEALPADLGKQLVNACKTVINVYGPTETTIWSSSYKLDENLQRFAGYIPIGKAIDNTTFYLLDAHNTLVPYGQPGELHIGGAGLAKGYYNNPDETGKKFVNHIHVDGRSERLYKTGDLVRYLDNGDLEYINRIDNQVKIRGFRIELGDIEAAMRQFDGVANAVCIAVKPEGQQFHQLVGFVIAGYGAFDIQQLKEHLREVLPAYMVPSVLQVVENFPQTPNGKIDRKVLASLSLISGFPDNLKELILPRTLTEVHLAEIWQQVLGIEKLSVKDDFFEMGGHSILAIKVISRIHKQLDKQCSIATLMQNPTIEKLAAAIETTNDGGNDILVPLRKGDKLPFVLLIPGEGGYAVYFNKLAKLLASGHPVYGLQFPGLNSECEPLQSVEEIASLYADIVRTNFDGGPVILAGHSFGGNIAFELADILVADNYPVESLLMIDTLAPVDAKPASQQKMDDTAWLSHIIKRIGTINNLELELSEAEISGLPYEEQIEMAKRVLAKADIISEYFDSARMQSFFKTLRAIQNIAYTPAKMIDLDIVLLKAANNEDYINQMPEKDNLIQTINAPDYNWHRLTTGTVHVKLIPGNHDSVLEEPNVSVMAEEFNKLLTINRK